MRILTTALLLLVSSSLFAAPGLWYAPDREGTGLYISRDNGAGHAVIWFLHDDYGRPAWLISGENCQEFPCEVDLYSPTANWMGGDLEFHDPVGELVIGVADEKLRVKYEVISWVPDLCAGLSPGGLIFNKCVGQFDLTLLAE